jgi:hypothetical protein
MTKRVHSAPLLVIATVAVALAGPLFAEALPAHLAGDRAGEEKPKELDLRAPDIAQIYTSEQIDAFLAKAASEQENEAVEVESTREPPPTATPRIWTGLATPFWALLHPTQAWRVFFPIPPDQTRGKEQKPDATQPAYGPDVPFR